MAAVLAAAAAMNIRSVSGGARLVEIAVSAKLVPLLLFVVVGAAFVRPDYLRGLRVLPDGLRRETTGVLIFAFLGIEGALRRAARCTRRLGRSPGRCSLRSRV